MGERLIFWPSMSIEIWQYIETFTTYADCQPAEPQVVTTVPRMPWQQVTAGLFSCHGKEYLITVGRHNNYFEVDRLNTLLSLNA